MTNSILKRDGSQGHTSSTENMHCKISSLALRRSAIKVLMGLDSYLLQCFQALVHSQSISQCSGSRRTSFIKPKAVHEREQLVQVVKQINRTMSLMSSLTVAMNVGVISHLCSDDDQSILSKCYQEISS